MSEETPRHPARCAQCGRPPVFGYELPDGHQMNFCLEHAQQFEAMNRQPIAMLQEQMDRLDDEINDTWGLPRRPRAPRIPPARVNLHQVHIHGDNLGVVNTGTVGTIENNLSVIHGQNAALAEQLRQLTEAVLASAALDTQQKRDAVELLGEVTENAAKPPAQRRSGTAMRVIMSGLGQVLSHTADLYTLWTAIAPHLRF